MIYSTGWKVGRCVSPNHECIARSCYLRANMATVTSITIQSESSTSDFKVLLFYSCKNTYKKKNRKSSTKARKWTEEFIPSMTSCRQMCCCVSARFWLADASWCIITATWCEVRHAASHTDAEKLFFWGARVLDERRHWNEWGRVLESRAWCCRCRQCHYQAWPKWAWSYTVGPQLYLRRGDKKHCRLILLPIWRKCRQTTIYSGIKDGLGQNRWPMLMLSKVTIN